MTADVTDATQVDAGVRGGRTCVRGRRPRGEQRRAVHQQAAARDHEHDWDLQHDVMAKGSFLVSRAAARAMIDQGLGGDIVYISSKNSLFAGPNNVAYGAAKADQAHQVRLLAAELGGYGIRVNGVNPDGVVRGPASSPRAGVRSGRPSTASPRRTLAPTTHSAPC